MNELERTVVGRACFLDAIEPAQQLRARRVQVVVLVEVDALDKRESSLGVARFRDGGSLVELDRPTSR